MIEPPDFEALYTADADPYRVTSSWYERRKLAIVTAMLTSPRYRAAWDPACGTGDLAAALAERCDTVLATDLAGSAIAVARRALPDRPEVIVAQHRLPAPPTGVAGAPERFDLVVLAEWVYYLDADDRRRTLETVASALTPDAEVLAVHWRHHPHDAHLSGAAVQTEIVDHLTGVGWARHAHLDDPDFVLDVLRPAVRD